MRVRGHGIFPTSIAGRFSILFAILRQIALVFRVAVFTDELRQLAPDVIFVDQLSACIPLFNLFYPSAKILFYGHFPDRLLAKEGTGMMQSAKTMYRKPFDAIESWTTACADSIVVNSKFTRSVFKQTFPSVRSRDLRVIYPCVQINDKSAASAEAPLWTNKTVLLSINRYEGKKNISLAIRAFAGLASQETGKAKLVIAGGFDPRVQENASTLQSLQDLASSLHLNHRTYKGQDTAMESDSSNVVFLLSVPDTLKHRLLASASLLIYTPQNEHFGIVPIEAMLAKVPVLATNTGGPLETIYDGRTGWLRSPEKVEQWTDVMRKPLIASSADNLRTMGERGRERVLAEFSRGKMIASLDEEIRKLRQSSTKRGILLPVVVLTGLGFLALLVVLAAWSIGIRQT